MGSRSDTASSFGVTKNGKCFPRPVVFTSIRRGLSSALNDLMSKPAPSPSESLTQIRRFAKSGRFSWS